MTRVILRTNKILQLFLTSSIPGHSRMVGTLTQNMHSRVLESIQMTLILLVTKTQQFTQISASYTYDTVVPKSCIGLALGWLVDNCFQPKVYFQSLICCHGATAPLINTSPDDTEGEGIGNMDLHSA